MDFASSKFRALSFFFLGALVVSFFAPSGLALDAQAKFGKKKVHQQKAPAGFTPLFNGKDLSGWRGRPHLDPAKEAGMTKEQLAAEQKKWDESVAKHWSVENGEIVNDGHGAYLTTLANYGDMDLRMEYRTVALADSGIYLRATPQVQIWDTTEKGGKWNLGADKGSGALWNNQKNARFPLTHADKPFGEWNSLRIVMLGERVSVWLNGKKTVDHTIMENFWNRAEALPARGPVQLQTHGGEIRFRNLFIKSLSDAEANQLLSQNTKNKFKSLFNGVDLSGWAGAVEQYEVVDGAIRCKQGSGGNLYTEDQYADFQVRFEFKLPPGGNNGLAIRYPGKGTPAYEGMCELQVLDNTHPKYAKLKDFQYHGSVYGIHAARRGFLRPVGEWNFQEVTVQGTHIRVVLNGTTIVDQDIAALGAPADGRDHPGMLRPKGHFGFAGHNDPVLFRNISIREL